ncbi:MAG: Serine/threonine-protein kinase PrkC [Planctomycetota bacterium]
MSSQPNPASPDDESDLADRRMAEFLERGGSGASLRQALGRADDEESSDILARLDALDFVEQVVGPAPELPSQIGGYAIKGLLGKGGMGTVYLGYQPELEREVALKVLSPNLSADLTMRKRFRAEARATAALHHRHIVPIYDYGEASGMLFFAMERVDGMSLDKHIAEARRRGEPAMSALEACRRFAGVADALGLAHRRRLLHRDVKPGNILVATDGTMALTDFGLAKALDQASVRLTSKGGGFLGTLHYAAPEQATGADLTPASDLYSLGVTMFEAITGELPLAGATTEALLQALLHGTPKRLRDLQPKAPRDLDAVLEKLLSREPQDRYQDGEELSRDLLRVADGEPVHIRRLPIHVRLWRRARKNPVLSGAILTTAVLMLVTLTLATVLRREKGQSLASRHQNNLSAIVKVIGNETGSAWGGTHLLESLTGARQPAAGPDAAVLRALDAADREVGGDPAVAAMRAAYLDDPLPFASALLREGRGYEALRLYDQAVADALALRSDRELAIELRLFGLYLGRGVANLTAAVARLNDARTDLALAAYLRPGAVFPRALLAVLDVVQSQDVVAAARRLERDLDGAAAERLRVVGLLLWTAAGLQPPVDANLMEFSIGYDKRRVLHQLAAKWIGVPPDRVGVPGTATGFSALLARSAREALERRGEPDLFRAQLERSRELVDRCVHPESPLQGWRSVQQLLENPSARGSLFDREGRNLSATLQLAAWEDLLRIAPPRQMAALWLQRFEELRRANPNLPGMARVAAQLHYLAQSPEAERLLDAWVADAEGDPDAHLLRMRWRLRAGRIDAALDDGMYAVQSSALRDETLQAIVAACEESATELGLGERESALALGQSFRALQGLGGGRR